MGWVLFILGRGDDHNRVATRFTLCTGIASIALCTGIASIALGAGIALGTVKTLTACCALGAGCARCTR